jgi:hypothetical protein
MFNQFNLGHTITSRVLQVIDGCAKDFFNATDLYGYTKVCFLEGEGSSNLLFWIVVHKLKQAGPLKNGIFLLA